MSYLSQIFPQASEHLKARGEELSLGSDLIKCTCMMTYNVGVLPKDSSLQIDVKEVRKGGKTGFPNPAMTGCFKLVEMSRFLNQRSPVWITSLSLNNKKRHFCVFSSVTQGKDWGSMSFLNDLYM